MKNCIILGSGRSGTSMVAGTLANSGYFMGEHLLPGSQANPKGFFEDQEINRINEDILALNLPKRPRFWGRYFFLDRPLQGQRWLARIPLKHSIQSTQEIEQRIQKITLNQPFCFKDPRFSYTLPIWQPYLANTVFVCVFRDPFSTAKSILKEVDSDPHLHHFQISFAQALEVWKLMYLHILKIHHFQGGWLFLHYNQVLYETGLEKLADFTGATIDFSFPDRTLNRSQQNQLLPQEINTVYQKLCDLADYQPH